LRHGSRITPGNFATKTTKGTKPGLFASRIRHHAGHLSHEDHEGHEAGPFGITQHGSRITYHAGHLSHEDHEGHEAGPFYITHHDHTLRITDHNLQSAICNLQLPTYVTGLYYSRSVETR
jgi:hypothetical protein